MLFSVIIPTHNRLGLLREALASVRSQRFSDYEAIVVDDGSEDGTVEALAGEGDWLRVIPQPNLGPGAARNRGAAAARGEYLAFLDSDDLWFPWTLDVFAALIARHERPALLCGRHIDFANTSDLAALAEVPANGDAYPDYLASSRAGCFGGAGTSVIERQAFLWVGGFSSDMRCGEDHDLALRLGTAPGFVQVRTPVTIAHRRHPGSAMADGVAVLAGLEQMFATERAGRYPGGTPRAADRRRILSLHARPVALQELEKGNWASAVRIYRATLPWHLAQRRFRFIVGLPVLAAGRLVGQSSRRDALRDG